MTSRKRIRVSDVKSSHGKMMTDHTPRFEVYLAIICMLLGLTTVNV